MIRALIIEDNPGARTELRELLSHHPEVTIVGEAATVGRAHKRLTLDDYDLVFLDIELRGGTGFDLVPMVRPAARIIFVTAYDEHAIRAFTVNALDYLLKPVEPARLAESLSRLGVESAPAAAELAADDLVHLPTDEGARFIAAADISVIRAAQNYTHVHQANGEHHFIRRTLKSWEDQLCPHLLTRVARDALVNFQHVRRYESVEDNRTGQLVLLGCNDPIVVTQRHWPATRSRLDRK